MDQSTRWLTQRSWDQGEAPLNYAIGPPSGPPLVFLHGVVRRWQDFVPLLPALLPRWQVTAFDFRGHGRSGRGDARYLVTDYARDIAALLPYLLGAPAVLYGHSLGALVAMAVAAGEPEMVAGLVLEDPPAPALVQHFRSTPYYTYFARLRELACIGGSVPALARELADIRLPAASESGYVRLGDVRDATSVRFIARCLQDLDPAVLTPVLEEHWLDGYDVAQVTASIRCPVLLLRADERAGGMLARADAAALTERMADCTSIDLPGVSHQIHWAATETTLRLVLGFLESLSPI